MTSIGFIGQGFVGKSLADNISERGFSVVRYSLDPAHAENKEKIRFCHIVFIAVPTPTTPEGFDARILEEAIGLCSPTTTVVIKSTVPGDIIKKLDNKFDVWLLFSPEFLDENTAKEDTDYPCKNIIGTDGTDAAKLKAEEILKILPEAPYEKICSYDEAAAIKYLHNSFFLVKNVFFNLAYDFVKTTGADWDIVIGGILSDPRITPVHTSPVHKGGRGAGGHCLIKDFAVFSAMFTAALPRDLLGFELLTTCEKINGSRLMGSNKDVDILRQVYDKDVLN